MLATAVSSRPAPSMARALALYADAAPSARLHVHARHWLCPMDPIPERRAPRWKYLWARSEEQVMTALGLTEGQGLYFYSAAENQALLAAAGFEAEIIRLDTWLPYPHVLFVARPAADHPESWA